MTVAMESLARTAADRLQGSCSHLAHLGDEFEEAENNLVFCATLDSLVFCCTGCDWWFEQGEMASDWKCEDCTDGDA